jgi:hypothetical protein
MAKVEDGGMRSQITMDTALNYGTALFSCGRFSQAQTHFHRTIKVCGRAHAAGAQAMLNLKLMYARSLYEAPDAPLDDLEQAGGILASIAETSKRVMGDKHPISVQIYVNILDLHMRMSARPEFPSQAPA